MCSKKEKNIFWLCFKPLFQSWKTSYSFNDSKRRRITTMIFIVWVVFILSQQKTNLNLKKKVCEKKDFCNVVMPSQNTKILEFNWYQKSIHPCSWIHMILISHYLPFKFNTTVTDQLLVISFVKIKKSKTNYTRLF